MHVIKSKLDTFCFFVVVKNVVWIPSTYRRAYQTCGRTPHLISALGKQSRQNSEAQLSGQYGRFNELFSASESAGQETWM